MSTTGGKMKNKPAYITQGHSGEGFAELAAFLLSARADIPSAKRA